MILFPIRGKCAKWNCCCFWRRIFLNGWRKSIYVEAKNGWKGEQGIFFLSLVSQWRVASVMIVMQWRPLPCVRGEKTLYGLLSWGDFYQIAFWLSSSQSLTILYITFWMPYWVRDSVQCFILHRDVKALKNRSGSFKSLQAGMEVESELLCFLVMIVLPWRPKPCLSREKRSNDVGLEVIFIWYLFCSPKVRLFPVLLFSMIKKFNSTHKVIVLV